MLRPPIMSRLSAQSLTVLVMSFHNPEISPSPPARPRTVFLNSQRVGPQMSIPRADRSTSTRRSPGNRDGLIRASGLGIGSMVMLVVRTSLAQRTSLQPARQRSSIQRLVPQPCVSALFLQLAMHLNIQWRRHHPRVPVRVLTRSIDKIEYIVDLGTMTHTDRLETQDRPPHTSCHGCPLLMIYDLGVFFCWVWR